jgi:hypothetical protein
VRGRERVYIGFMPEEAKRVEQEKTLVTWRGLGRPFKKFNWEAMAVPTVIAILVGVILLVAGEWMLIVVVAALVFAVYMWSTVAPEEVEYLLTNKGLRMFSRLYEWPTMTRWWLEEKWGGRYMAIESWVVPMGKLYVPIEAKKEGEILAVMEKYLVKDRPADTAMDKMGKWVAEKFPMQAGK